MKKGGEITVSDRKGGMNNKVSTIQCPCTKPKTSISKLAKKNETKKGP